MYTETIMVLGLRVESSFKTKLSVIFFWSLSSMGWCQ